ncbi:hypothetical protein [Clostridium cylindrosporum]|uniref:DUF1648 domain-containing protein n=1 Tax=Clostridium cylindrosporum DSM 605 TaxID=1121307 RepID=A0A0J8DE18_CLOCY|nr:hypothetical protein [Clostridium cylindrosporum]KMT22469.1 hypothetical protein CLCY_10c00140 [Clostridium cylindrosporum DSM 605]
MIRKALESILDEKYSRNNLRLLKFNYTIIIFLYIFSAIILKFLPKDMPMQWAADGSVNYTLPSIIGVWILPTILLLVNFFSIKRNRINIINTIVYLFVSIVYVYTYVKII